MFMRTLNTRQSNLRTPLGVFRFAFLAKQFAVAVDTLSPKPVPSETCRLLLPRGLTRQTFELGIWLRHPFSVSQLLCPQSEISTCRCGLEILPASRVSAAMKKPLSKDTSFRLGCRIKEMHHHLLSALTKPAPSIRVRVAVMCYRWVTKPSVIQIIHYF